MPTIKIEELQKEMFILVRDESAKSSDLYHAGRTDLARDHDNAKLAFQKVIRIIKGID